MGCSSGCCNEWKRSLCFLPDAGNPDVVNMLLIKHDKIVQTIQSQTDTQSTITHIAECEVRANFKPHVFVLFHTEKYVWSIEKDKKGITLQRGSHEKDVKENYKQSPRRGKIVQKAKYEVCRLSVAALIKWLRDRDELNKKYSLLSNNCICFAKDVMQFVCSEKEMVPLIK